MHEIENLTHELEVGPELGLQVIPLKRAISASKDNTIRVMPIVSASHASSGGDEDGDTASVAADDERWPGFQDLRLDLKVLLPRRRIRGYEAGTWH